MTFGFLIFPGLEELDLVGPWEMIALWSKLAQGPEKCLMVAEKPGPVICSKGMSINPHVTSMIAHRWITFWYREAKVNANRWIIASRFYLLRIRQNTAKQCFLFV